MIPLPLFILLLLSFLAVCAYVIWKRSTPEGKRQLAESELSDSRTERSTVDVLLDTKKVQKETQKKASKL